MRTQALQPRQMACQAPHAAHDTRCTVLALLGAYWPGHDSAGPNQSFSEMCQALGGEFRFRVIARDRPFGSGPSLAPDGRWIDREHVEVRYCRVSRLGAVGLARSLRETPYGVLLLNSLFDREFTIPALLLRRLGLVPQKPTLLSPRGELADGSLGLKSWRKRLYLALARRLGLLSDVWLHAASPGELEDIRRRFPWSRGVLLAPNVRELFDLPRRDTAAANWGGITRLAFLGRITAVKNLDYALKVLGLVRTPVAYDIYGPMSDPGYWRECKDIIAGLPDNVAVTLKGEIPNRAVPETLARYDLLLLPTRGENFGHAILEALASGLPVLISDRTPWQDLEQREAGWSLPLAEPHRFAEVIDSISRMPTEQRQRLHRGARCAAEEMIAQSDAVARNRQMLRSLLGTRELEPAHQQGAREAAP